MSLTEENHLKGRILPQIINIEKKLSETHVTKYTNMLKSSNAHVTETVFNIY